VRLLARQGGDILDLALAGQIAIVDGIEEAGRTSRFSSRAILDSTWVCSGSRGTASSSRLKKLNR
jgi:hypothetical protein